MAGATLVMAITLIGAATWGFLSYLLVCLDAAGTGWLEEGGVTDMLGVVGYSIRGAP